MMRRNRDKPIVIIGGGPTGLAAAYYLAKKNQPFILIEKEKYLGGLSATLKRDGYLYEFGPHAFHLKDPQITKWLKGLLGEDFRIIPTNTHVLIDGQIYSYPLKAGELLRKIRPSLGIKILWEYVITYFKKSFRNKRPQSFEDWGLKNFGPTLYKMSFGDYTNKVWGIPPKKLSAKLAYQKISRLNLADIIIKLLGFRGKDQPAYFHQYLYPEKGVEAIFNKMLSEIRRKGKIILGARITKLKNLHGEIQAIKFQDIRGRVRDINPAQIISTITIKDLAGLLNHPLQNEVLKSSQDLKYRDLMIIYLLTREKNPLFQSQWIYLVEDKYRFNRLMIGKNLSPKMAPKNQTVLAMEICCQKNDFLWRKSNQELLILAKEDLSKLKIDLNKISDYFVVRIENAYPIYIKNFEKNVKNAIEGLGKISNLLSTGRNGLYLNSDIHDSFLMGFSAARDTISKNKSPERQKAG
ncbi:MAG: FAD-dependent oxidoreductase [Patescibacteria group bacterium]